MTGYAGHSPCVKKRTMSFKPVGGACRGLDVNRWRHGKNKPAEDYSDTRNPARGRANQTLPEIWLFRPNTRAQVPTLVASQCGWVLPLHPKTN